MYEWIMVGVGVVLSERGTVTLEDLVEELAGTGLSEGMIAFTFALILVTFLHVVFGEMIPKNISFSIPERPRSFSHRRSCS